MARRTEYYIMNAKGGDYMKKIILLMKKASMSSAVASFALMFGVMASTRNCFYILHQPEMPADMKKLRKF